MEGEVFHRPLWLMGTMKPAQGITLYTADSPLHLSKMAGLRLCVSRYWYMMRRVIKLGNVQPETCAG